MPVVVLFFRENGLSMFQIMLLQAIFSVSVLILEIPSGYYADVFGRKKAIVLGTILGSCGFTVYSLSQEFWGFLIAELILGLGSSFISGSDSALLFESLKETGQEADYMKAEGQLRSAGNMSEAVAAVLGGLLATISLRTPLYFETALSFVAIPFALSIVEPKRVGYDCKDGKLRGLLKIVYFAFCKHGEVSWLIIYSASLSASTLTLAWLAQPYLQLVNLPLALFGVVWFSLNFSVGVFSLLAHRFEILLGRRRVLQLLAVLMVVGYFLLFSFQSLWGIGFLFIFYFVRGLNTPISRTYLNELVTSDRRATVLSITNMISRLIFACLAPLAGWITDFYSLKHTFFLCALFFCFISFIPLITLIRIADCTCDRTIGHKKSPSP